MERISEDQVDRLVRFVSERIPDPAPLHGEARRAATALRLAADKQIAAVRFHRATPHPGGATPDVAAAAWNLLVSFARIWRDHPEFPADAAQETFGFECDAPL
ncbi:hypothetical protein [Streptomyces sp. enrichment culture]|uniref:hypothetical protein n=1 Tax=Streptomyces sp. enrichment culture TaxID=1795815 RepID=UPI003F55AA97